MHRGAFRRRAARTRSRRSYSENTFIIKCSLLDCRGPTATDKLLRIPNYIFQKENRNATQEVARSNETFILCTSIKVTDMHNADSTSQKILFSNTETFKLTLA